MELLVGGIVNFNVFDCCPKASYFEGILQDARMTVTAADIGTTLDRVIAPPHGHTAPADDASVHIGR